MINEAKERELYDAARTPKCHEAWLAWLARARKAAEDAEKWLPIEQFPDTPADVWFAFSDGAVEFYGDFMFSDNDVWYPNKPTHFMLAKIPPQPAAQEGDTP